MPGKSSCTLLSLLLLFSATALSQEEQEGPAPAPDKPVMATERSSISTGVDAEAIARRRPDAAVWLTDSEQRRVLALFQPEQDSPARGALVILADEGVSAAGGLAASLREHLSRAGWAVMTLGLEAPPFGVQQWLRQQGNAGPDVAGNPVEKGEADGGSAAMINLADTETRDDALNQYRDRVVSSLTAAVDLLTAKDYQRIVLAGVGRAAGHVTRQAREDGRASDLIWIAPHFYADESRSLTGLLESAASPSILELYSSFPAAKALDRSARERAAALQRAGIAGYSQQPAAMARQPQPREAKMLANRISSWLR
jgi:hypothetical protein